MGTAAVVGPGAAVASAGALIADAVGATGLAAGATAATAGAGGVATAWIAAQSAAIGTMAAATPFGWVIAGTALVSGAIIVAGDKDFASRCCWEQVLPADELSTALTNCEADIAQASPYHCCVDRSHEEKVAFHREHGMLIQGLAPHTKAFKARDDERLILKNKDGQYFAFEITLPVKAGTHGNDYDVTIVHAVPVQRLD